MDRNIVRLGGVFTLLVLLFSCEKSSMEEGNAYKLALGSDVSMSGQVDLAAMSYTLCLFRAEIKQAGEQPSDADYKLMEKEMKEGLTQAEVAQYSFKMSNEEVGMYAYLLFAHATPMKLKETKVEALEIGDSFPEIVIGLVKGDDGNYVPLSKDNYFASQILSAEDIESGATSIKLSLKRLVGQLVFDFFKSSSGGAPLDIETGHLSTLDRVKSMEIAVSGMTTQIQLAGRIAKKSADATTQVTIPTQLNEQKQLDIASQDTLWFRAVEKTMGDGSTVYPEGGTRAFTTYLLPTGLGGEEILKTKLTFSYHDTPFDDVKTVSLNLPSVKSELKVIEGCYTLTNIRLKNNRVIDLDTSGEVSIDTDWESNNK